MQTPLLQVSFLTHYSFLNNVVTTALKELDANQPSEDRAFPLPKYMLVSAATRNTNIQFAFLK